MSEHNIKRVAVIGHFGFGKNLLNGQTVKTKTITEALEGQIGKDEVIRIDTHGGVKAYIRLPFQMLSGLNKAKNIIILPAHKGLKAITPLLLFLNKFYHRKLHYCVIGGWLPEVCGKKKWLAKILKKLDYVYVETQTMKVMLEQQGFENIVVMPNFKNITPLTENELVYQYSEPYRLCTFSRVMREKGIEDAINAVKFINEANGRTVYTLDIYGQVDSGQTEWFEELKNTFPNYVRYKGQVPYDESVSILKAYYALLFPTYYKGEGFAGTLIDAMAAGIPSIASDWKYNSEIVKENENGLLFPAHSVDALIAKILELTPSIRIRISKQALITYNKYRLENVIGILANRIT